MKNWHDIKYIYSTCDGRLCNWLYVFLRTYKLSKELNQQLKIIDDHFADYARTIQFNKNFSLKKYVDELNLSYYYCDALELNVPVDENIVSELPKSKLFNDVFNDDFDEYDIIQFSTETILKSQAFKLAFEQISQQQRENTLCIHIRTGDYLRCHQYDFNFKKYVYLALQMAMQDAKLNVVVYTEDIDVVFKSFNDLLKEFTDQISYVSANDISSLMQMSLFKKKICWNSSFSAWSAYLNNVIYPNNYENIFVPNFFHKDFNDGKPWIFNPKWNHVDVN